MSEAPSNVIALPHGRTPPHNLDAERSLLGGLLLDGEAIDEVLELVHGTDFYRDAHRKIFEAMVDLAQRTEPIDRVQVKNKLVELGAFDGAGGDDYLDLLDKIVPTAANLQYYAKIVSEKSLARRTIEAATLTAQLGYEQHGEVHDFVDQAEARFFDLRSQSALGEFKTARELLPGVFKEIERRHESDGSLIGVTTGLEQLDVFTGGLRVGLTIIAARPSMGKSALAKGMARAVCEDGGAVAYFSLEDTADQVVLRLLSDVSGLNLHQLSSGKLLEREWGVLASAAGKLADLQLHIYGKGEVSAGEIRAQSRRLFRKCSEPKVTPSGETKKIPLRAIFIDYLQLMYVDDDEERRDIAIGKNTRQLKGLAQQLGVPVVLLAQLNRQLEHRPEKRPRMSDLRESGAIENDGDVIMFIYRDEIYNPNTEDKGVAEIIIGKNRNGPTGTVRVGWVKECTSFRNLYQAPPDPEQAALPLREEPPPPTDRDR